jgi:hypothetical protein
MMHDLNDFDSAYNPNVGTGTTGDTLTREEMLEAGNRIHEAVQRLQEEGFGDILSNLVEGANKARNDGTGSITLSCTGVIDQIASEIAAAKAGLANNQGGYMIYRNPALVEPGEPVQVKRTWRDRLFSTPWSPLRTHTTQVPMVPSHNVFSPSPGVLICHPAIAAKIAEAFNGLAENAGARHVREDF